ncbi:MAG: DEAD/DEAH box helicase family protein, partial [Solirubrobacteraceae bacterium]
MAQRPSAVVAETTIPDPEEIDRIAAFTREPFVVEGESADDVLALGTVRRHAFEAARRDLDAGATEPSLKWRRRWALLLGLDRMLQADVPTLADGTTLNPHQVDALSGTYAALLAEAQRRTQGVADSDGDALVLSFEVDEPTADEPPPAPAAGAPDDEPDDPDAYGADDADDADGEPDGDVDDVVATTPVTPDEDDDEDDEGEGDEDRLDALPDAEPESESASYDDEADEDIDEDIDQAALEDPNAHKRFWFEHATGAGKTVAAMGFVEATRTGGVLILTHRRNLVDQFIDELQTRGYGERLCKPLLGEAAPPSGPGPVTIETYQWFVRNAGQISGAYTVVICDEAHTALGEKTSASIRAWTGPIFIGMTATGALIARHVTDLFPTQTSRFDLAQAARRGVIAPLRGLRIPPGPGVRTIAKVPLRKGEVDMEFDQDELAKLLDQVPFNLAIADLYKTRFRTAPGVVYAAGVKHAYNVAESFRAAGINAEAVSGETPKRELATILARYDAGEIDVLVNAQLLAEGWNSPRATVCMHLAPTASKRIYQQRVGRVTRRHPGKEAGVVVDFVHPATQHDDPVVTLHSLLDRDVYRGGAIVVGPVRRGRGRRVKVERRVVPVTPDIERRRQVFERELWRIAVEQLDWGEQRVWAALAGAKASPTNWRRGRAMLNFDRSGELRRQFLVTALERNRNPQLRIRAIQEIAVLKEAEPFDTAVDQVGQWPRDERREASRILLQALADGRIGRRDQATAWIWRLAGWTRDIHEEYAAQRWPATKHLLGLLVNSSGAAHARNARRVVHAARQHDRRLQAALLAAAVAHTPEAEEVLREARTRLARKPGALSRDLLKDFPKSKRRKKRGRKKKGGGDPEANAPEAAKPDANAQSADAGDGGSAQSTDGDGASGDGSAQGNADGNGRGNGGGRSRSRRNRSRNRRRRGNANAGGNANANGQESAEANENADANADAQSRGEGADAGTQQDRSGNTDAGAAGEETAARGADATSSAPNVGQDDRTSATAAGGEPGDRAAEKGSGDDAGDRRSTRAAGDEATSTTSGGTGGDVATTARTRAEQAARDADAAQAKAEAARERARAARARAKARREAAAAASTDGASATTAPSADTTVVGAAPAPDATVDADEKPAAAKPTRRRTRAKATTADAASSTTSTTSAKPATPARAKAKPAGPSKAKPETPADTDDAAPAQKAPTRPTRRSTTVGLSDEERAARRSAAAKKAAETRRRRAAERAAAAAGDAPAAAESDPPAAKPTRRRTTTTPTTAEGEALAAK